MSILREIDPEKDLTIDVTDLSKEFRKLPLTLFDYYKEKTKAEKTRDLAKAKLKEVRALTYKRIKSDTSAKHTEKSMEAEIDTDPLVLKVTAALIQAEHDASTLSGAVDSMKAKKDCLIQLGSDRRKEIS